MSLGDVLSAGNFFVEVGLAILAIRGVNAQQNHDERIRIFEIMQERGMLPETEQVMSLPPHVQEQLAIEIEERIDIAYRDAERNARQKVLPAPKQQKQRNVTVPPRGHTATVKNATGDYRADQESYIEEDGATTIRRPVPTTRRRVMRREEEY